MCVYLQMICSNRAQFSCDNLCGNPLACGNHYCTKTCHALQNSSSTSDQRTRGAPCDDCTLPCQKVLFWSVYLFDTQLMNLVPPQAPPCIDPVIATLQGLGRSRCTSLATYLAYSSTINREITSGGPADFFFVFCSLFFSVFNCLDRTAKKLGRISSF